MGRDKGKGRGSAGGRGGGKKMFIENVEEMAIRDNQVDNDKKERALRRADEDDENEDEEVVCESIIFEPILHAN
jgi:hypothetical protein